MNKDDCTEDLKVNVSLEVKLTDKISFRESEVAFLVGVSTKTLRDWRIKGEAPPHFQKGKLYFYPRQALYSWVMDQLP